MSAPFTMPLSIRDNSDGTPSVKLGGLELANLLAPTGLKVEYVDTDGFTRGPVVTLTFGPGALTLDAALDFVDRFRGVAR